MAVASVACCFQLSQAKTRWSATQIIPDADLLSGGQFTVALDGFYSVDENGQSVVRPGTIIRFGIMEWVNIEAGYTGGATFGFKARLLGENSGPVPSIAIGAHNIVTHKEPYYYNTKAGDHYSNEFYLAFGKTVEPFKTRFHLGVQSMPTVKSEMINGFGGFEKYFGNGLYLSVEAHMRDKELHPSIFAAYRFLRRKLELSLGVVEIRRIFFDEGNAFRVSFNKATGANDLVRPGIWFGLRYMGDLKAGKRGGFASIDDRIESNDERLDSLASRLARIEERSSAGGPQPKKGPHNAALDQLNQVESQSSTDGKPDYLKTVILEKLMTIRTLYKMQPFEPEKVRAIMQEIAGYRDRGLTPLKEIMLDKTEDRFIRMIAISLLGEVGDKGASSVLLDIIGQTEDPDIKVEIIIALGKLRETRAAYLFEQLSNDPNDAVAFAAQEMLQKLVKETGMETTDGFKMREVSMHDSLSIHDRSLETLPAFAPAPVEQPADSSVEKESGEPAAENASTAQSEQVVPVDTASGEKTVVPEEEIPEDF